MIHVIVKCLGNVFEREKFAIYYRTSPSGYRLAAAMIYEPLTMN